jgi:predicted glycoside hydrolase/deacetylase ChbG (UPF0249 family)
VPSLIISADDFGFTPGINRGIIEAFEAGVVTAVSMLVYQSGWRDAVRRAHAAGPALDIGLHLNLIIGAPLTQASSLTDRGTGDFLPVPALVARALAGRVRPDDAYAECLAQAERLQSAGLPNTHIDGHRHLHVLPGVWAGVVAAAHDLGGVTVRVPREPAWAGAGPVQRRLKRALIDAIAALAIRGIPPPAPPPCFLGGTLHGHHDFLARIGALVATLPGGTSELLTHPGYVNGPLPGGDRYNEPREVELRALTSSEFRDDLRFEGVTLTSFRTMPAPAS